MLRRLAAIVVFGLAIGAGGALVFRQAARRPALPDAPTVVLRIREAARLETLDVSLYRKIAFAPEPEPADSIWGDVFNWIRFSVRPQEGRAIVFADAHVGFDFGALGPGSLEVADREVWIVLPPLRVVVELKPGETEVIGSNLDSAQTARLFELAKLAFEREVAANAGLRQRARSSAELVIRGVLGGLGFSGVHFVESLPGVGAG